MITPFPQASANPFIDSLRQAMDESKKRIEWLIIAHEDDRMIHSLTTSLSDVSLHVISLPQKEWDFTEGDLVDAIEWALEHGKVRHVALAGHSQAEGRASDFSRIDASGEFFPDEGSHGYHRLREGVQRTTSLTRESQACYETQVKQFKAIPTVRQHLLKGDVALYGLFFMSESASFLAYDDDQKSFLPLYP